MLRSLALAALLAAAGAAAHDKMNTPEPRVATEGPSGATDCSVGDTAGLPRGTWQRNTRMRVAWDKNHNNNDVTLELAPTADVPDFANQGIALGTYDYDLGYADPLIPGGAAGPADGAWTLRWRWQGYITCADITIQGECAATIIDVTFNDAFPQAAGIRINAGEKIIAHTEARALSKDFRLVASSTNGVDVQIGKRSGCETNNGAFEDDPKSIACYQIGDEIGSKYFEIAGDGAIVDIGVEQGLCADLSPASTLTTTAAVVVLALIALLF